MSAEDRFTPNYYRVEKYLRDRIQSGDLKPGHPIPTESQLSQQFGISRMTVRQALSRLVFEGLIERQRGRGSFVAEARFLPLVALFGGLQIRAQSVIARDEIRLVRPRLALEGDELAARIAPGGEPGGEVVARRVEDQALLGKVADQHPCHIPLGFQGNALDIDWWNQAGHG